MNWWMTPTWLVALLLVFGAIAANRGWLEPIQGFSFFLGGSIVALLSAVGLAGAAAIGAALGKPWRRSAVVGAIVPLLATVWLVLSRLKNPVPPIHDITTDMTDPPTFAALDAAANAYDAEEVGPQQSAAYPDVKPIEVPAAPAAAFERAVATARAMPDWEVVRSDPASGAIEATSTSRVFRFVDDVSIRVRPSGAGARIDLRSRSRVGESDLGANAARILAFRAAFESGVAGR
jgi:uncharacterized protein (DUF1499 family)